MNNRENVARYLSVRNITDYYDYKETINGLIEIGISRRSAYRYIHDYLNSNGIVIKMRRKVGFDKNNINELKSLARELSKTSYCYKYSSIIVQICLITKKSIKTANSILNELVRLNLFETIREGRDKYYFYKKGWKYGDGIDTHFCEKCCKNKNIKLKGVNND